MERFSLLVIDPQNDFCDIPGAALPVPGANADMIRLSAFMEETRHAMQDVIITMDSHPGIAIERTSFWQSTGEPVLPFTVISADEVRSGQFGPRDAALTDQVLAYIDQLEAQGKYRLMVWPVHCVLGTWGHNIHASLAHTVSQWEVEFQRNAIKVLKGMNPFTEQYSAVQAEVPRPEDPGTQTNSSLVRQILDATDEGWLLVAGEASSHCVAATLADLFTHMVPQQKARVVLLSDCMSPVPGCEGLQSAFLASASGQGARVLTARQALDTL